MASNGVDRRVTKRLKTPKRAHFQGQLTSLSHPWALDRIREKLTEAQKEIFRRTCFGHFLDMSYLKFSGQLIHNVLLREVHTYGLKGELWFLVSGVPIRFSCTEFGLIMGLRFGDEKKKKRRKVHRLRDTYFNGNTAITHQQFDYTINNLDFTEIPDNDAVKLSLVFLAERFLLQTGSRRYIDPWLLQYVDNLSKFNRFPWGNEAWETTYNCLRKALVGKAQKFQEEKARNPKHIKEKYNVTGVPLAFQVWCYEAIPCIGSKYGNMVPEHTIPRILKWATRKVPTHQEMSRAFSQLNDPPLQRLQPTENEVEARFYRHLVAYRDLIVEYENTDIHIELFGGVHDELGEQEESDAGVDAGVDVDADFEAEYTEEYIQNMHAYLQKQFQMLRMDISRIARRQDELKDEFEAQIATVRSEARRRDEFIALEFARLRQELRAWSGYRDASSFGVPLTDIPCSSLVYNEVAMTDVPMNDVLSPNAPMQTGVDDQPAYFDMVSASGKASIKISAKAPMGESMLMRNIKVIGEF